MKTSLMVAVAAFCLAGVAAAQPGVGPNVGTVVGRVYDAGQAAPVEYANVVLYSLPESTQVNGTVTDKAGAFRLDGVKPGRYYLEISFIGYRDRVMKEVEVTGGAQLDLGHIDLEQKPISVQGVEATAEKPAISKTTTVVDGQSVDCYMAVWQDHRNDSSTSFYPGGNGETDYHWDIWGQEIRLNTATGHYELYLDSFLIRSDVGRQTNVDIDGRDVVWQSQAPDSQDIYVWGAVVPEPSTLGLLLAGAGLAALRRRR